jgi:hypothetical protein
MLLILVFTVIVVAFILLELIPIYQKKQKRLFRVYASMLAAEYILAVLLSLGVKIPSPAEPIKRIVSMIFGLQQ